MRPRPGCDPIFKTADRVHEPKLTSRQREEAAAIAAESQLLFPSQAATRGAGAVVLEDQRLGRPMRSIWIRCTRDIARVVCYNRSLRRKLVCSMQVR